MANFFESLRVYGSKWSLKNSRAFTQQEKDAVNSAQVVDSEYGKSVCFMLKTGGSVYVPLSRDSDAEVGQSVDIQAVEIQTLSRPGDKDIERINI